MNLLEIQKEAFSVRTACVTRQGIPCAKAPVAGNYDGYGIFAYCISHGLGGHSFFAHSQRSEFCQFAIGGGFAPGNLQQKIPHKRLESCTLGLEEERASFTGIT